MVCRKDLGPFLALCIAALQQTFGQANELAILPSSGILLGEMFGTTSAMSL